MIQVTFLANTELNIETIHQDDLQDWLDNATHCNITIIHIDKEGQR